VERFFERFFVVREDVRELAGPKLGAIGPVTAAAIRSRGLKVDLLAKEYVAEGIINLFTEDQVREKRFLIPRAEKAREILPQTLADMGGLVEVVTVYRTGLPAEADVARIRHMLEAKELDAATFTSSSTVTHLKEMLGDCDLPRLFDGITVASIGPVTSNTLRECGLNVDVEAEEFTVDGLVTALAGYYALLRARQNRRAP
jgi:uroporphyrinogen III methyltransferase/synthase